MMSNDKVASLLNDIARRCRDGEEGYRLAAEDSRDGELKQQLRQLSRERAGMADELDALIRKYGGEPPAKGGTLLGAAHRAFVDVKAALSRDDRRAVLEEVARGESVAEESYDAVKREELPQDVKDTIGRHHARVRATRDRYRQMSGLMSPSSGVVAAAIQAPRAMGQLVEERPILSASMAFFLGLAAGAALMNAFSRSGEFGYAGASSLARRPGRSSNRAHRH